MGKLFLKLSNSIFSTLVFLLLLLFGCYALYALWDNNQVLTAANNVQEDMIKLKPTVPAEDVPPEEQEDTFAELLKVNPDVVGWITMDNTNIDFPVLQGKTNLEYINRNVYGEYSLAGSIYLDSRNDPKFEDSYSLLYGHHMENSGMFGDLDLYKMASFFEKNTTGSLILPHRTYRLDVIACLVVDSAHGLVFEPLYTSEHIPELLALAETEAMVNCHREILVNLLANPDAKILTLSTCSSEFSDARTVVLASMSAPSPRQPYK